METYTTAQLADMWVAAETALNASPVGKAYWDYCDNAMKKRELIADYEAKIAALQVSLDAAREELAELAKSGEETFARYVASPEHAVYKMVGDMWAEAEKRERDASAA